MRASATPKRKTASPPWASGSKPVLDLAAMLAFKDSGVKGNVEGVAYLLKKHKIDHFHGTGRVLGPGKMEVTFINGEKQVVETKAIVIATGSEVMSLPGIAIDEKRVVSSTGALSLPEVPKRMAVIGAGYIGLELGSVWSRLGAEVTVIEMLDRVAPGLDGEVAKQLQRTLAKQGIAFKLGTKVVSVDSQGQKPRIDSRAGQGRNAGNARLRRGSRRRGPRSQHPRSRPRRSRGSRPTIAAGSRSTRNSQPPCPASTPSAT